MVSDRSNKINRGVVAKLIGLAIVAAALFFLIRDLSTVDSAYSDAATDAAVEYERDAQAYIKETCFPPTGLGEPDCVAKAHEAAREGQRKEQDLAAQNITAWWTKVMGIAAMIGTALSGVGVWLVKATFDATRRSNDIARESLVAANRAWLRVTTRSEFSLRFYKDCMAARTCFAVHNIGSSVAKEVKVSAIFQIIGPGDIVGFGKDQLPLPVYTADRNGLSIWPDKDHEFDRHVPGACPEMVGIPDGIFQVLMKVVVRYKTIYDTADDNERITEVIYEVTPDRFAFNDRTFPKKSGDEHIVNCGIEVISAGGWRIT